MARFCNEISVESITRMELINPFRKMKFFDLTGVHAHPLTLEQVPQRYRPYEGCLFDVLSEPDCDKRRVKLREFFLTLATPGDPGRECGLLFTVMQLWRQMYAITMYDNSNPEALETFEYLIEAGWVQGSIRILGYSFDREFLLTEYNRYVPYRLIETFFVGTQGDLQRNERLVNLILEDEPPFFQAIWGLLKRGVSWLEELVSVQLMGNFSCYPRGVEFLLSHPEVVGVAGSYLWKAFENIYINHQQFEDHKLVYHKALIGTEIQIMKKPQEHTYKPTPARHGDLTVVITLCNVCNVCAAHPDEAPMERIEPCLYAVVKEGLFTNIATVCYGIVLTTTQYHDLTLEKFLSFLSWSTFNKHSRKLLLEQVRSLPRTRHEDPLFFDKDTFTLSRSVLACLISHALWLDNEKNSHFSILGLVALLTEDDDAAVEVIKIVGPQLFDLAHSIHHVKMPGDGDPLSVKRVILETFLRLSGGTYFTEKGDRTKPVPKKFDVTPPCVVEGREFCERYTRELKMTKLEKQRAVKQADAFKSEGNDFFIKQEHGAAILCYTRALDTCPLTCTERRVTYYSNRAECYLKTHRPQQAISDCNRALAMNPHNLKARWRRAQAMKTLKMNYPASLDLWTIKGKPDQAKEILGEQVYNGLEHTILGLLDCSTYVNMTDQKYGPMVFTGQLKRDGVNKDKVKDKTTLPPYRGQTYQEIFGLPRPVPQF